MPNMYGKSVEQYVYMLDSQSHWVPDVGTETVHEDMHVTFERPGHAIADAS